MKQQRNKKRPENASARVQNFKIFWGACPRTPLGSKTLRAFGKYTCLLLLSTHLCKNLLKPLLTRKQKLINQSLTLNCLGGYQYHHHYHHHQQQQQQQQWQWLCSLWSSSSIIGGEGAGQRVKVLVFKMSFISNVTNRLGCSYINC